MSERERRGFASMDEQRRREIASEGGRASHQRGTAHEFSPDEARMAGRKGGRAAHAHGRAHVFSSDEARMAGRKGGAEVSKDRAHMSAIGRKGGERSRDAEESASAHMRRQAERQAAPSGKRTEARS